MYIWHWYLWPICWWVWIRTVRPCRFGVREGSGSHSRYHQSEYTAGGLLGEINSTPVSTGLTEESYTIHWSWKQYTESMRPTGTDSRGDEGNYEATIRTVSASSVILYWDGIYNQPPMTQWDEASRSLAAPGTHIGQCDELAVMTRDVTYSGEEVRGLRMWLPNYLTLAARAAPAAPQSL